MAQALAEAKKGLGRTSPNPCVGAVIVSDGVEISRGYHKKAGTPHAEIHALNKAGGKAKGATIYVTLEPCNHTGRTPPCSHAVAAAGIKRVVVGMTDPNPLVSGSGLDYLRANGVDVISGVLEKECRELNLPFLKHITSGLPYVIMKAGISLDGKLSYQKGISGKITGPESLHRLHELRNTVDAILVGSGTQLADNPSLTTRRGDDAKDPLRVVLDSSLRISPDAKILHLSSAAPTLIVCTEKAEPQKIALLQKLNNVQVQVIEHDDDGRISLLSLLRFLGEKGICSLLVEGGAEVHSSFLRKGLIDRVMLFVAPLFAGSEGTPLLTDFPITEREAAPLLKHVQYIPCGDDILVQGDLH
ncbi:MAG: bifunctional diaminohydroxyphosphoribosylaminopyrimidine deaminase/5-amino-6-(5-phosphoribosylamino)uracil reductase RibD [Desulfocapsa sp.]|nr:MAG: bifunctional diaminohydroxyphosphoribosylaminopyrimidine deaminase/5-amino-6-(5-phosphoribosylamino)uracil reductase RibD [Desulfocapsa sp.]